MTGGEMRACETCGGYLLHESEPFEHSVRVLCLNCGQDYSTPRREPTAQERDGTQAYEVDGVMHTRRRHYASTGGVRL